MASQIVLMRELLIVFYGNELSLGITLACWLFWIAFGSWGIGRWILNKIKGNLTLFAALEIIQAPLLLASLLCVRFIPSILNSSPGEIIGVLPMSITTFILLAPICVLGGFLFVLGCEIYPHTPKGMALPTRMGGAVQIGHVYILEAIGATLGGLLTSFFLVRFLSPLYIMSLIGFLNLCSAFLLFLPRRRLSLSIAVVLAGFIFFIFSGTIDCLRSYSLKKQWAAHEVLASENSVYGNIVVTRRQNLYSIFINGLYDFSVPDPLTSERNAHFPLLQHPAPSDVLLIGGGSSEILAEVLKHPGVERVDYVELDPLVIELARTFLPKNNALNDPRVKVITRMDGRLFMKKGDTKYDVLIINLPEPHTAQLNRFYTMEFYIEAKNRLKDKGILSFCLQSNPNYISQEQAELYLTLKRTLEHVFENVEITPGETNFFLASAQKGMLSLDWQKLMKRLKERKIDASYLQEYYLFSELSEERIEFFKKGLEQADTFPRQCIGAGINRDFHPIAYYYNMILWSTYSRWNLKTLFKAINPGVIFKGAVFFYLLLLIPLCIKLIKRKIPGWGVLTCVATSGFAEINFQIVTLLSFQILYGYVYYKLGIVLTSYMAGLILGGWLITRRLNSTTSLRGATATRQSHRGTNHKLFIKTQVAISIYPLILPFLFFVFSKAKGDFSFWLGSNIFPFLPIIPGIIGGFQFPLANSLYINSVRTKTGSSAGLTYGLDIFGACIGAILTSVFLIPVIGIPMTCLLVAGLNLTGLILLLTSQHYSVE